MYRGMLGKTRCDLWDPCDLCDLLDLCDLWDLCDVRDPCNLWDLWDPCSPWDLWHLRDLVCADLPSVEERDLRALNLLQQRHQVAIHVPDKGASGVCCCVMTLLTRGLRSRHDWDNEDRRKSAGPAAGFLSCWNAWTN